MISDLDIYRSAKVIMRQYGEDAQIHAAMRAPMASRAGAEAVTCYSARQIGEVIGSRKMQ
jgi:hypothetical protein